MGRCNKYETYIAAFWAHPDDVDVGCAGVLYQSGLEKKNNVIIDLTPSQLSSQWDPKTRKSESKKAASLLWVNQRINLNRYDDKLTDSFENRLEIAKIIRKFKPEIVLIPRREDRHPDHETTSQIVKNAVHDAALIKLRIGTLNPHKPRLLLHYLIQESIEPDIIVSLSEDAMNHKMRAIQSYVSQDATSSRCYDYIKARHIYHGRQIGAKYWEAYKLYMEKPGVVSFDDLLNWFF